MNYGDIVLGVECALPCALPSCYAKSRTAAAGAPVPRKEDRDTAPEAPAGFGNHGGFECSEHCYGKSP